MKTVGYHRCLPIDNPEALLDLELPDPEPGANDLLVKVHAASVNPVDIKTRLSRAGTPEAPVVLGWDACGEVLEVGSTVKGFKPGDRVWYAGAINRPGCNAELHCVDARLVSLAPQSLDDTQAAALPLTSLTAWECLFERLGYDSTPGERNAKLPLLLINGAGGLGSMILQGAKLVGIPVTATASREASRDWCQQLGASEVIAHQDIRQLDDNRFPRVICAHDTDSYFAEMTRLVAPQGLMCAVASTKQKHDLQPLMAKSAGFVWELMFTRSLLQTADLAEQGKILQRVAKLVDDGKLQTTLTESLDGLSADTFISAHRKLEQGGMVGKLVVAY